ncbi:hypothetical protein D6D12_07772 [Aureobasidium pullulans]|uniref:Uncharacterized protein n=1 Tax=Aureobasidium pullulans TaxID=5580 RepID=A0A4S9BJ36_AURPU|nr:hypothetical protein D6D15_02578 [Aureobasidium pullulans]THX24306.1 hypothetical protein D6D12_07772 [Aureobasidium pullulans]THX55387.1 hypothetical protein D6D11_03855 [Aureobasidium pullulans]
MQELFGHVMEGSIAQRGTLNLLLGATWQIVTKLISAPVSYMYRSLLATVYAAKLILEQFPSVVNSFVAVSNWTEFR